MRNDNVVYKSTSEFLQFVSNRKKQNASQNTIDDLKKRRNANKKRNEQST